MAELTNQQIAVLSDIGEFDLAGLSADKAADLRMLLKDGYVVATDDHPASKYRLTGKGSQFLSERGAGLNEA